MVYHEKGAEALVAKLAAFNLAAVAYRPPPAIDDDQLASNAAEQASVREANVPGPLPSAPHEPSARNAPQTPGQGPTQTTVPPAAGRDGTATGSTPRAAPGPRSDGEGTVRAFYAALGAGSGAAAVTQVVPEKRTRGPFSAGAISRFYGRLPEPLRLTSLRPAGADYRVTYRYSAGRSHCNGVALVRLTNRGGRELISSIRSLRGC